MTFIVSAKQIVIMFLLMLLGFLTGRLGMIHKETAKDLTNFLLYIISPCLIVNAYLVGFSMKRLIEFFQAIVAVTLVYSVSIIVSHLIINRKFFKDQETRSVLLYGSAYSNAGFMGIPLVSAILGESAVFFFSALPCCLQLFHVDARRCFVFNRTQAFLASQIPGCFEKSQRHCRIYRFCHLRFRHQTARTRFDADQVARFGQHPAQHGRRRNKSRRDFFFKQKKSQDGRVRNFCQKHPDSADLLVYFAQRADFRSGCLGDSYHGFLSGSCRCCFIFIAEQF